MDSTSLAQFLAINDQIVALVRAGVPVYLGLPQPTSSAAAACEQIGATVARRVGEGTALDEALEDPIVPVAYRSVVRLALQSGDFAAALSGASRMAEAQDDSRSAVRMSLRYPLVVCGLAYAGMVLFCLFLVPTLESMYQSMRLPEGWGLLAVRALRSTLPYWIAIPPLGLGFLLLYRRWSAGRAAATSSSGRLIAWLPGMARALAEQRQARFAETLAGYLEAGASLPAGLRAAAAAWESSALQQGTLELAASVERGQFPSDDGPFATRLPPLLRWAIWHADEPFGRSRALRMAADFYVESSQHRVQRLQVVAPIATCAVIGGGVTLLYGLALFVPVAQMIQGLAG